MQTVSAYPQPIREIEHIEIPMSDGCRLAGRIWLPVDADEQPVPAILEYIPYRKRDATRGRDALNHPYFAGHGYACVRVDVRGAGESDGVLTDEYLQQELEDGVETISWIAAQPWCDGNVGMMGISWGGFNSLQIAAMQPLALKAVISCCSTDDRYADDVHYMGGCLLTENLHWAASMFDRNTAPPDPALVGEGWRESWLARLEGSGHWLEPWLSHQRRDAYWKHGSVCEDFSRISCPVYAIGGWADAYSNAVFRLLQGLRVPCKGLIGPWSHRYPHYGIPGPAIGFLQEALRWWDRWLKGVETGVMDEPQLRVWMQDSVPPRTYYDTRPGRWVAEPSWPSPNITPRRYALTADRQISDPGDAGRETAVPVSSPLSVGLMGGKWCSYAYLADLPGDQREDDGGSLVFDSGPLAAGLEILGAPVAHLKLTSDQPVAQVAVRLSDVAPNGASTRVSYGVLNLTHRDSHEHPEPLDPGRAYEVSVRLNDIAHCFAPNHRLRLAISTSYWPVVWPAPEPTTLWVHVGACGLDIPVRPPRPDDDQLRRFPKPESAPPLKTTPIKSGQRRWTVVRDLQSERTRLEIVNDEGLARIDEIDLEMSLNVVEHYSYERNDYNSVRGEVWAERSMRRGDWRVSSRTHTILTSDHHTFRIRAELDAYEGEARVHARSWDRLIPRELV